MRDVRVRDLLRVRILADFRRNLGRNQTRLNPDSARNRASIGLSDREAAQEGTMYGQDINWKTGVERDIERDAKRGDMTVLENQDLEPWVCSDCGQGHCECPDDTLGSCGCVVCRGEVIDLADMDYHMNDCPIRTGADETEWWDPFGNTLD